MVFPIWMKEITEISTKDFFFSVPKGIRPSLIDRNKTASAIEGLIGKRSPLVELLQVLIFSLNTCFARFQLSDSPFEDG